MFESYSKEITGVLIAFLTLILPKIGVPVLESLPELVQGGVGFLSLLLIYVGRVQKGDVTPLGKRK